MPALMGSAAGAGLALLLTPKSGERIRRDLKRFAEDTREQVGDIIDEGRDLYEEGRKVVARAVKGGKETYNEGMDKISKLMHKKERSLMVLAVATGIIGVGAALLLMPKRGKARELESEKYYLAAH
jgi:gas vesicle protein